MDFRKALTLLPQRGRGQHFRQPFDPRDLLLINAFRPMFYVSVGERMANLDRAEIRGRRVVGFYSIVCRNPRTGLMERYAARYGVRRGVVTLEKIYPTTIC